MIRRKILVSSIFLPHLLMMIIEEFCFAFLIQFSISISYASVIVVDRDIFPYLFLSILHTIFLNIWICSHRNEMVNLFQTMVNSCIYLKTQTKLPRSKRLTLFGSQATEPFKDSRAKLAPCCFWRVARFFLKLCWFSIKIVLWC